MTNPPEAAGHGLSRHRLMNHLQLGRSPIWLSAASSIEPNYLELSAWYEHAPFAGWLVENLRPDVVVELGTHTGFSHFAICQAVKELGLPTRCFAVDTWQGDEHAGFYDDSVFKMVDAYNKATYADFSTLIRATFDEALPRIPDKSVDLLHLDGRHFYEDVKHDFNSWTPKLSDRAVVILHDTDVRDRGFGVYKFWAEIQSLYPSFEFKHGHGLGVVGYGAQIPERLRTFFQIARDPKTADKIRQTYARLGKTVARRAKRQQDRPKESSLRGLLNRLVGK